VPCEEVESKLPFDNVRATLPPLPLKADGGIIILVRTSSEDDTYGNPEVVLVLVEDEVVEVREIRPTDEAREVVEDDEAREFRIIGRDEDEDDEARVVGRDDTDDEDKYELLLFFLVITTPPSSEPPLPLSFPFPFFTHTPNSSASPPPPSSDINECECEGGCKDEYDLARCTFCS